MRRERHGGARRAGLASSGGWTVSTLAVVIVCLAAGARAGLAAPPGPRAATDIARLEATAAGHPGGRGPAGAVHAGAVATRRPRQSQEAVARAVAPLHDTLRRYEQRVAELERDRVDAYAELREQVRAMSAVSGELRTETKQLVAALRAPQVRGRWGEHQLRRIVEAAGMLEHCDFAEQVTAATDAPAGSAPTWWSGCTAAGRWWWTRRRRSTPT